jgi:hypothetical protein
MAHGRHCCNFCSDSRGTDIDHFEPIAEAPLRTFDWRNHLLACSRCNTHAKRERFPRDRSGSRLLVDPTVDDPWDHLRLTPSTGKYFPVSRMGRVTIELLLDDDLLARGRRAAWLDSQEHVIAHWEAMKSGNAAVALDRQFRLLQRPNLDAFYAMLRWSELPSATVLFDPQCLGALIAAPQMYRGWIGLP